MLDEEKQREAAKLDNAPAMRYRLAVIREHLDGLTKALRDNDLHQAQRDAAVMQGVLANVSKSIKDALSLQSAEPEKGVQQ